jgi:hypothetical protein
MPRGEVPKMRKKTLKRSVFALFAVCTALGLGSSGTFGETGEDGPRREETWLNVYIRENKAGYEHLAREDAEYRGRPAIGYTTETHVKMTRFGTVSEGSTVETDYVDDESRPLGFVIVSKATGLNDRVIEGAVDGGELKLEVREGDKLDSKTLKLPDGFLFEDVAYEKLKESGYTIGETVSFFIFSEKSLDFVPMTMKVIGKEADAVEIRSGLKAEQAHSIKTIVTGAGDIIKVEYSDLCMKMVRVRKEEAEEEYPGLTMSFFSFKTDKPLINPRALRKLKLEVAIGEEHPALFFVSDDRQRIRMKEKSCILNIKSIAPARFRNAMPPLDDETRAGLRYFLEPSDMVQSDDPLIQREAKKAAGSETDMWVLSARILLKTRKLLSFSYELGYASALDAIRQGKGDCTEYALVFAALARSLGIPVKVCHGLVYADEGYFTFHAWDEVFVGRWVPIDPSSDQVLVDATHIAIHKGDGGTPDFELFYKTFKLSGHFLEFKVLRCSYWD